MHLEVDAICKIGDEHKWTENHVIRASKERLPDKLFFELQNPSPDVSELHTIR